VLRALMRREGLVGIDESPAGTTHGEDLPEELELERVLRALVRREGLVGIGESPVSATHAAISSYAQP